MEIIKQYFTIEDNIDANEMLKRIERAGRTCYKSEHRITENSATAFVASILKRGHESVIEHEKITVRIITDRGVTHELVRHRLASYSQESTRYCNYADDKFNNNLCFIQPVFFMDDDKKKIWLDTLYQIEKNYLTLINLGASPQEARAILPNCLKTEIVVTMNLRQWRHFFKLRTDKTAHPQIRELAIEMQKEFKRLIPIVFDN